MSQAMKRLAKEYKAILSDPNPLYCVSPSEDNFLKWDFIIIGPEDTCYEGGIFKGTITFTKQYPHKAPNVQFNEGCIIHPNIYDSGSVCISILHEGHDSYGYESLSERWTPAHSVNTVMLSIISLLSAPNFESPANIYASTLWRDKPEEYEKKVWEYVAKSQN